MPEEAILIENSSRTTEENAKYAQELLAAMNRLPKPEYGFLLSIRLGVFIACDLFARRHYIYERRRNPLLVVSDTYHMLRCYVYFSRYFGDGSVRLAASTSPSLYRYMNKKSLAAYLCS